MDVLLYATENKPQKKKQSKKITWEGSENNYMHFVMLMYDLLWQKVNCDQVESIEIHGRIEWL